VFDHGDDVRTQARSLGVAGAVGLLISAVACGGSDRTGPDTTIGPATVVVAAVPTTATSLVSAAPVDRQALLDDARESYDAPGALAVVRHGDVEWSGVSGFADLRGTVMTATTRFRVASITKPIVALLVLDAVSRGQISLDARVSDLIPDVWPADPPTSVRMLLDHTSGIFNVGDEGDIAADIAKIADPVLQAEATDLGRRYLAGEHVTIPDRLFVALALVHDRYFEPGRGYHYSNVNYQLAAMVLTRATGQSLADLLRLRVTEPLGLSHTSLATDGGDPPEMRGYGTDDDGSLVDLTDDLLALGNGGSGGVISTGDELLTIMQSIVAGELLPQPLAADMTDATSQSDASYGLGVATYHLACGTFYGHGGAINGTRSIALSSSDGTDGVVIAANVRGAGDEPDLLPLAESLLCAGD